MISLSLAQCCFSLVNCIIYAISLVLVILGSLLSYWLNGLIIAFLKGELITPLLYSLCNNIIIYIKYSICRQKKSWRIIRCQNVFTYSKYHTCSQSVQLKALLFINKPLKDDKNEIFRAHHFKNVDNFWT